MKKICIIIHLYYTDLWDEIKGYLDNIKYDYDLHISLSDNNEEDNNIFLEKIKDLDNVYIYKVTNKGLDIGPFLAVFNIIVKKGFDYGLVLKLHTKKGLHGGRNPERGEHWRNNLLVPILNSTDIVDNIIKQFEEDGSIGIIGSNKWLITKHHPGFIYNHKDIMEYIEQFNIKTKFEDIRFIGGTIFWCRFDVYKEFFTKHNMIEVYNELETGAFTDSSSSRKTHALERIMSLIMMDANKKIIGI